MTRKLLISYEPRGRCPGSPRGGEPCIEVCMVDLHGPRHIHAWAGVRIPCAEIDHDTMIAAVEVLHVETDRYAA